MTHLELDHAGARLGRHRLDGVGDRVEQRMADIREFGEFLQLLQIGVLMNCFSQQGDFLEVGVSLRIRDEIHHHQVNRLAVGGTVINSLRAPSHGTEQLTFVLGRGMGTGPSHANPGIVQRLPLESFFSHTLLAGNLRNSLKQGA